METINTHFVIQDQNIVLSGKDIEADRVYLEAKDSIHISACQICCKLLGLTAHHIYIDDSEVTSQEISMITHSVSANNNEVDFNAVTYNGKRRVLNIHQKNKTLVKKA